jgi:hydrogenase maturation protease
MPEVYLFVVSIETIQQQGIELTGEIQNSLMELKEKVKKLINVIKRKERILA